MPLFTRITQQDRFFMLLVNYVEVAKQTPSEDMPELNNKFAKMMEEKGMLTFNVFKPTVSNILN